MCVCVCVCVCLSGGVDLMTKTMKVIKNHGDNQLLEIMNISSNKTIGFYDGFFRSFPAK